MGRYRLTPDAIADLEDIAIYTQQNWGVAQRDSYIGDITQSFESLAERPYLGRPREDVRDGLRSLRCHQHIVFYRVVSVDVEILRVLHHARDVMLVFRSSA